MKIKPIYSKHVRDLLSHLDDMKVMAYEEHWTAYERLGLTYDEFQERVQTERSIFLELNDEIARVRSIAIPEGYEVV